MKRWTGSFLAVVLVVVPGAVSRAGFDQDNDGDVDLADYVDFHSCFTAPDAPASEECAQNHDYDGDLDVDLADFRAFQAAFTGELDVIKAQLAGNSLSSFPFFEYVKAFNEDATVEVAIDPTRFPEIVGQTCDVYIVEAKTIAEWGADPSLIDVRVGGPGTETFGGTTIQDNTFLVAGAWELDGDAGIGLGVGYDVVLDCNMSALLDSGDVIDGHADEAGLYVVHDTTQAGPLAVTEVIYSGGLWLGQDTFYPTNIASMGELPLVVISHDNGELYTWYDHLGFHLASYGCIVMSHQNNTMSGAHTASTTTLTNTDYIIGNQDSIQGGVLDGHIDSHSIVWIGHGRGGEGVVRAYDRIYDGIYSPTNFDPGDIVLIVSLAPTDFLGPSGTDPHDVNFSLWTATADSDCDMCQSLHLHDRADGFRHSAILQGAVHANFHNGGGASGGSGPCLIGRENTHLILKGYLLPLVKHYTEGNIPATDFFWRQLESFRPIGVPPGDYCPESGGDSVVVTQTYHDGAATGNFVIDDYQTQYLTGISSSGGVVTFSVDNLTEDILRDIDGTFTWSPLDPMNGMTHAGPNDDSRGVVFDWDGQDLHYELEIIPSKRDLSGFMFLSFRACQGTRHPLTVAELGDLALSVTLRDGGGTTSSINIGAYGGGIEEPYQRSGAGEGVGWVNEMETIRIRLTDYLNNGSGLDLTDIEAVRFDCGPSFGSSEGRIGLDDIELTGDGPPA